MAEVLILEERWPRVSSCPPTPSTARNRKGEVPAVRVGKVWRFPKDFIVQWLRERAGVTKEARPRQLGPKKDPLLKFIGSIEHHWLRTSIRSFTGKTGASTDTKPL